MSSNVNLLIRTQAKRDVLAKIIDSRRSARRKVREEAEKLKSVKKQKKVGVSNPQGIYPKSKKNSKSPRTGKIHAITIGLKTSATLPDAKSGVQTDAQGNATFNCKVMGLDPDEDDVA